MRACSSILLFIRRINPLFVDFFALQTLIRFIFPFISIDLSMNHFLVGGIIIAIIVNLLVSFYSLKLLFFAIGEQETFDPHSYASEKIQHCISVTERSHYVFNVSTIF